MGSREDVEGLQVCDREWVWEGDVGVEGEGVEDLAFEEEEVVPPGYVG